MNIKLATKFIITAISILLYGCEINSFQQFAKARNSYEVYVSLEQANTGIWDRLRNNFCLNLAKDNKYVQFHTEKYKRQSQYLQQVSNHAAPYLSHIVAQLEQRKMPGELALLPMIESSFNPHATSHMGAAGIWQLAVTTGKRYGLKKNEWYDGRKDVVAATNAALSYLQYLYAEFDEDWFLALAAYNAGEGRVKHAISRNLAQNKPTDFWSLSLPNETKNFVPKLLALANLVKHADLSEIASLRINNLLLPHSYATTKT